MQQRRYRITVERLNDAGGGTVSRPPLVFTARNHDEAPFSALRAPLRAFIQTLKATSTQVIAE